MTPAVTSSRIAFAAAASAAAAARSAGGWTAGSTSARVLSGSYGRRRRGAKAAAPRVTVNVSRDETRASPARRSVECVDLRRMEASSLIVAASASADGTCCRVRRAMFDAS